VLRYHLALPDLYLREGRVILPERFLFASYPGGAEMLYAPALALGGTIAPRLLHWLAFLASTALLHGALAARLPRLPAALLAAAYAATPFLSVHAAAAGVDHFVIALSLAGTLAVLDALEGRGGGRAWRRAGWMFGSTCAIKYLGAYAAGCAALALVLARPRELRGRLRAASAALPWFALVPAAWGAKNWLFQANPLSPYVFGHREMEPDTFRLHLRWAADWAAAHPWWRAWADLIPVALTRGIYDGLAEALSPAFFLAPALAVLAARPSSPADRWLLWLCAALWAVWAHRGGGIFRYLAPLYPATVLLAGRRAAAAAVPPRAAAGFLAGAMAVQLPLLLAAHARQYGAAAVLLGCETPRAYLARVLPPSGRYLSAMARACGAAGGGRLYVLGDPKAFYAPCRCRTEFEFAPPLVVSLAAESPDPRRMAIRLRQRGVGAVLYRAEGAVSVARMSGTRPAGGALERLQAFWASWAEPVWVEERVAENVFYHLYRLRQEPGPFRPPASALWWAPPGAELVTQEVDRALDAGRNREALDAALALAAAEPGYAPAWHRAALAAGRLGEPAVRARAKSRLAALGFERLPLHD
jgi:hypothetical protein